MADPIQTHRILSVSKTASVDLAAYRFVILSTDREACEYPGAQYAAALGITMHAASAGQAVEVAIAGIVPLQVDNTAAISLYDGLCPYDGTTGKGMKAAGSASRPIRAIALDAPGATGDCIPVELCRALTTA